eukprot:TRINITY_DN80020_c0_g1_i1.p1 TRINITY_DN80020_c0_g1~~TRINITY_DN80020_c0_g1_i1.p1  ORF type:complete len:1103 (+),score=174.22 TRINITY_DN80020_c0_g1_i1:137-3445(+)
MTAGDLNNGRARTVLYSSACSDKVQVDPADINSCRGRSPNKIRTTRFTLLTWLPLSLYGQFKRAANIFFLFVSILVLFPWSPTMPYSTAVPFVLVLLWTALKDLYEDFRRKRDDDTENNRPCLRYNAKQQKFIHIRSKDVSCGDILLTFQDEACPADVLVISAATGQAMISTVNLDGETNLKERRTADLLSALSEHMVESSRMPSTGVDKRSGPAIVASAAQMAAALSEHGLECTLDSPTSLLTDMGGSLQLKHSSDDLRLVLSKLKTSQPSLLGYENFVPRGCVLRNTAWLLSVAAYVGEDTKTVLNIAKTSGKTSNMQHYLNRAVQGLVATLFLVCLYAAIISELIQDDNEYGFVVRFFIYWITLYQIVPIALYVVFEVLKLALGLLINMDKRMVDPRTAMPAFARTADLVEELGQVNFVFSDKTGTLTENEMVFARCTVAGEEIGDFRGGKESTGLSEARRRLNNNTTSGQRNDIKWFFSCLATCHSAQVDQEEPGGAVHYSGSSPDEVAFLEAARSVGIIFRQRRRLPGQSAYEYQIEGPAGQQTFFTIHCEIPFTSERKRMTIVCEHAGDLYCITKGADNVMGALCAEPFDEKSVQHLTEYSKLGLRTLAFASKKISKAFFEPWKHRLAEALVANTNQRDDLIACVAAELEHSLKLVGISAIEDRLQDQVPESIVKIKAAGIRFWVLTGDKTETAVEIVRSCRLFTDEMEIAYMVGAESPEHAIQMLRAAARQLKDKEGGGLVLDGTLVKFAICAPGGPNLLYELAVASRACVCCRLSPQQKRQLVELVKEHNKRGITLAIGDGANDVSMLQGAHVGIGVRGKEGNQAVQASDIAISQFRFLVPLLLCHGRRAYRRVATFLCYFVYKHVALAVGDVVWMHQYSFRGHIAYPEYLSSIYALIFTSITVLVVLALDQDFPDEVAESKPELYQEGLDRIWFNAEVFTVWVGSGVWHGVLAWLGANLTVGSDNTDTMEFWIGSCCSYTLVVTLVNLRLWMVSLNPWSPQVLGVLAFSFLCLFVALLILGQSPIGVWLQPQIEGVPFEMFAFWDDPRPVLSILLTPLGLLFDLFIYRLANRVRPCPLYKAMQHRRAGPGVEG